MPAAIVDTFKYPAIDELPDAFPGQKFMWEAEVDLAHLVQPLHILHG
jgi:hypothetical protein